MNPTNPAATSPDAKQTETSPLPWHVGTNGHPPESGLEPAFPGVHDSSGLPHGEDFVCVTLGTSERCKANAAFIVTACNQHAALVRANAELAERLGRVDWQSGIPPVAEGQQQTFWCITKGETGRLYTRTLCYGNKFVMPLSDTCDGPPKNAVPVEGSEEDYAWTGWWEESCEQCDTYWACDYDVVAWLKMPSVSSYSNPLAHTPPHAAAKERVADIAVLVEALKEIEALEPEEQPDPFPADWREQIEQCPECQSYKGHPIQNGICDLHRKPFYVRESREKSAVAQLPYRMRNIARAALAHVAGEGGKDATP